MAKSKGLTALTSEAEEHYRRGRLQQSAEAYDQVLELVPHHLDALEWRGEIAVQLDDYAVAAEMLGRARVLRGDEDFAEYTNLGLSYYELNRPDEAVETLWRAIMRDADDLVSHSNLGKALYDQHANGDATEAKRVANAWIDTFPDNPDARHIGAAISGATTPEVANSAYVADVFNDYADTFDEKLAELEYRAPAHLMTVLEGYGIGVDGGLTILDAGCGTGLLGTLVRPWATVLDGVDLSPGMLEKAHAKKIYDTLDEAELVACISARDDRYDLIAAADVFCYFGALEEALSACGKALRSGGHLAFSVEQTKADRFILNESGRYKHDADYVRTAIASAGLALVSLETNVLRSEYGEPVMGLIALARKD